MLKMYPWSHSLLYWQPLQGRKQFFKRILNPFKSFPWTHTLIVFKWHSVIHPSLAYNLQAGQAIHKKPSLYLLNTKHIVRISYYLFFLIQHTQLNYSNNVLAVGLHFSSNVSCWYPSSPCILCFCSAAPLRAILHLSVRSALTGLYHLGLHMVDFWQAFFWSGTLEQRSMNGTNPEHCEEVAQGDCVHLYLRETEWRPTKRSFSSSVKRAASGI